MSRSVPTFAHGAIPIGSNVCDRFLTRIVDILTTHQSGGTQAWEVADEISATPSTYDVVFHSVGDRALASGAGDTDLWIRIKRTTSDRITISAMVDYSPTSHTAYWENPTDANHYICDILNDNDPIEYWMVVNEYEIHLVHRKMDGNKYLELFSGGQLLRPYAEEVDGVARITSQSGTGDDVVFGLDRDISGSISPGQVVWLLNQTPTGVSLQSVAPDICTVDAITASQITLDGVASTYAVGSLVGLDPQPVVMTAATGREPTRSQMLMITDMNNSNGSLIGAGQVLLAGEVSEADIDPDTEGIYHTTQMWVRGGSTNYRGFRGMWSLLKLCPIGAQTPASDVMEIDWDEDRRYKFFSGNYVLPSGLGGWGIALGPGAVQA